jgi:hypothetical protein
MPESQPARTGLGHPSEPALRPERNVGFEVISGPPHPLASGWGGPEALVCRRRQSLQPPFRTIA